MLTVRGLTWIAGSRAVPLCKGQGLPGEQPIRSDKVLDSFKLVCLSILLSGSPRVNRAPTCFLLIYCQAGFSGAALAISQRLTPRGRRGFRWRKGTRTPQSPYHHLPRPRETSGSAKRGYWPLCRGQSCRRWPYGRLSLCCQKTFPSGTSTGKFKVYCHEE